MARSTSQEGRVLAHQQLGGRSSSSWASVSVHVGGSSCRGARVACRRPVVACTLQSGPSSVTNGAPSSIKPCECGFFFNFLCTAGGCWRGLGCAPGRWFGFYALVG